MTERGLSLHDACEVRAYARCSALRDDSQLASRRCKARVNVVQETANK